MALSGARNIEIEGLAFKWKAKGSYNWLIGWSPKEIRLVVVAPGGAGFTTTLFSKNWLPEHEGDTDNASTHKAEFTPGDVRLCIQEAMRAGWSPHGRGRQPFILATPPEGRDYGPKDAPRNENPRRYGPCHHGVRGSCWECNELRNELDQALRRHPDYPNHRPSQYEECLICFKKGSILEHEIRGGVMPERFKMSPWRIVNYSVDQRPMAYGTVCSVEHEVEFYERVRRGIPTRLDRILSEVL